MKRMLLVLLALVACTRAAPLPAGTPGPGDPPYADDEPDAVTHGDACAIAGRRLYECHCPELRRVVGMTFPAFCRDRGPAIDSACIASHACADLAQCGVGCGK
jgi:hypothetical protein